MEEIEILRQKLKDIEIRKNEIPFNALNLMYREILRKEELQSKIIGGFLNPNENHGYGYVPLTLFLNRVFGKGKFVITQESKFSVDLERYVLPPDMPARRIDILLSWRDNENNKHAIIIENKLNWAPNQPNQLNDYYDCLIKEGYDVDGLVYMPFSSKYQHSSHTDTKSTVLEKTIDFDAEKLVKWLEDIEADFKKKEISPDISSIHQYIEFWVCLITNNYATMKAIDIIDVLSMDEINKVENLVELVTSTGWCKARFSNITPRIESYFNENLVIEYKKWTDGRNYVQYFFRLYEFWVELWLEEKEIRLYIVSNSDRGETIKINNSTFSYNSFDINYYYNDKSYFKFHYNDFGIDQIEKTVTSLLKELEKFKELI